MYKKKQQDLKTAILVFFTRSFLIISHIGGSRAPVNAERSKENLSEAKRKKLKAEIFEALRFTNKFAI